MSKAISKYSSDLLSRVAGPFIPEADDLCIASYDITNAVGFPPKWNNSPLRGKAWLVFNRTKDPYQLSFLLKLWQIVFLSPCKSQQVCQLSHPNTIPGTLLPPTSTAGDQSQPMKPAPLGSADDFSLKEFPSHHDATEVRSTTHESRASCTWYKAAGLFDNPKIALIKTRDQILKIDPILFWMESWLWFWSS